MTLNLSMPGHDELRPRITVFGVGGAGGNAVNNMIEKGSDLAPRNQFLRRYRTAGKLS
jgi:cell division GTPase FtsZ